MKRLLNAYRLLNILSIDVALGAVCSSIWLADYFQVELRIYAYLALGITVWIIYTIDHLMDAKRIPHQAASKRHQFHQKYFMPLVIITGVFILVDAVLVFFVRESIFYSGVIFSAVIAVYLVFNKWLGHLKDFFVALLYSGGIQKAYLFSFCNPAFARSLLLVNNSPFVCCYLDGDECCSVVYFF